MTGKTILAAAAALLVSIGPLASPLEAAGAEPLTLRIDDAVSEPGGLVAVVLRTYASRPAGRGQVCLGVRSMVEGGAPTAFTGLEGVIVFSAEGDATSDATFDPLTGELDVRFSSASATINAVDGPLLVAYLRLSTEVAPGSAFALVVDGLETALLDESGGQIPLELRDGALTVRAVGDPTPLEADGDRIAAGEVAALGVATSEAFAIGSGRATLTFPAGLAGGEPVVVIDPRHGDATFSVSAGPGEIEVGFTSPDGTLNAVPGEIISIFLPIAEGVAPGHYPIALDPEATYVVDPAGRAVDVALGPDVVEVSNPGFVFADGFEEGLDAWSLVVR